MSEFATRKMFTLAWSGKSLVVKLNCDEIKFKKKRIERQRVEAKSTCEKNY